jgi:hypothetical protein
VPQDDDELVKVVSPVRVTVAELDSHVVPVSAAREGDTEIEILDFIDGETDVVEVPPISDAVGSDDVVDIDVSDWLFVILLDEVGVFVPDAEIDDDGDDESVPTITDTVVIGDTEVILVNEEAKDDDTEAVGELLNDAWGVAVIEERIVRVCSVDNDGVVEGVCEPMSDLEMVKEALVEPVEESDNIADELRLTEALCVDDDAHDVDEETLEDAVNDPERLDVVVSEPAVLKDADGQLLCELMGVKVRAMLEVNKALADREGVTVSEGEPLVDPDADTVVDCDTLPVTGADAET